MTNKTLILSWNVNEYAPLIRIHKFMSECENKLNKKARLYWVEAECGDYFRLCITTEIQHAINALQQISPDIKWSEADLLPYQEPYYEIEFV